MRTETTATVCRSVQELVRRQVVRELTDGQLLERFVASGDEAAFGLLVQRHGPMVHGICRRTLASVHDAEDAFQATFLVLVCKARVISRPELLGHWLYGVASRVATKARVVAARRRARERLLPELPDVPTSAAPLGSSVQTVLDDEIRRLPATYRIPFVLCHLEGLTNGEAAQRLGCPKGTLQSRLFSARQRLRSRLHRRGVGPLAALPAVPSLPGRGIGVVSTELVQGTVRAARAFGGWTVVEEALPARAAFLARALLHAMFITKLRITAVILLASVLPATAVGLWMPSAPAAPRPAGEHRAHPAPQTLITKAPDNEKPRNPSSKDRQDNYEWVTARDVVNKSYQSAAAPHVIVDMFNGAIDVTTWNRNAVDIKVTKQARGKTEAEARARLNNIEIAMTTSGETIHATAKRPEEPHGAGSGANALLHVPPGAILELHTNDGAVSIIGGAGAVNLSTTNGAVLIKEHSGSLNLRTSNGAVDIRADRAAVTATTSNSIITFAGTLTTGDHTFTTSNGNITLSLPKGESFRIDASTKIGRVSSTFPAKGVERDQTRHRLWGQVGNRPGFSLKLLTDRGSIQIRESESSSAAR
jgi:RNA polymerase sigma factor (sigma-70 family)